jgi:hypothetical protein
MSEGINNQYDFFKKVNLDDEGNIGVSLIGGDGQSLTNEQNETLAHFIYNPVTDQLEADRAITTTLNSFYLGEQHKMSSGGENMFFTNLTSDINFFPMWGGVKDHSDAANRTAAGVIAPSGRVYSDFFSLVLGDVTDVGVYLPYEGENTFGANISGLGITTTLGEDLPNTIRLEYRLYIGGKIVYSQPLENESGYLKDDILEWWFDHPVEIRQGTTIVAKITKVIKATDIDDGTLLVHSGVDTITGLTRYQTTVHNRVFADKNILLEGDIDIDGLQAEIDLNTSERHEHVNKTILDNFGEDANQNPTYNGNTVDTIVAQRDVYDGLDSTSTTVSLSAVQGKLLKDVQDGQQVEINSNTLAKHEHLNKTIIDSFAEDENQKLTYNGEVVGSGSELITQTLLHDRVTWSSEQNVTVPTKALGSLDKLNEDAFITATENGLYDVTVQLSFGNMTIDERLSFALLDSGGTLFPGTGQTFVTALSNGTLHSTQLERTTWRVNLVAGQKVYVGISSYDTDVKMDVYSHATHNGSYIELCQLPTQTVVAASDDVVPVTALENHYIPLPADVDWDYPDSATGIIFTLPAVSTDGRYFVDYGLNISPITSDENSFARTHIRINGDEAPWTTRYMKDSSGDVSSGDFKYMNGSSYFNLEVGDVVTLYMESANNVTLNGSTMSTTHVSFIRMNQLTTHTVVADVSDLPVTALFEQRTVLGSNVSMPVTTAGFTTFVEQIGAVTVPNDGKYLCRAVLPFAGVSDDSWVIRVGVAIMSVGESVYTQHSEERLQTSVPNFNGVANYDRAIDLQAGDKVIVTVVCNAADSWNIASTNSGCYLDVRQLPTHTVVQTISEEAVVVNDQASSGHVDIGTMRMQWGTLNTDASATASTITYPEQFGNVPSLTGSLTEGSVGRVNLSFSSVTATSANTRLRLIDSTSWSTDSHKVSWMAIGLKP